jgi:von Willebrand factor type A domain-containing protein
MSSIGSVRLSSARKKRWNAWVATGSVALTSALGLGCGSRSGLDLDPHQDPETSELAANPPRLLDGPDFALPEAAPGCVDMTLSYASVPPSVILLIDQSASMTERFGATTRWDVLRQAIIDPDAGLLTWLDAGANLGIMLYTSLDGSRFGRACPLIERVETRLGNAASIREFYAEHEPMPGGDTPTGDAIDVAVQELSALRAGPARYVLLLTDGIPDTCAEPDPQNGYGAALEAVQRAYAQGVVVRTVGVSPELARDALQGMANAGAGKPPELVFGNDADAEQPLYASTEPDELARQLQGAIGDVRSCTVELGTRVDRARAGDAQLTLDGQVLQYRAASGWHFVDADTIAVEGQACERILGSGERLQVVYPCLESESEPGPEAGRDIR